MEDLYGTVPSSGNNGLTSESEEINNILNQLLHNTPSSSSSSPPFSSASSFSSSLKTKYTHLLHPPPRPATTSFSDTVSGSGLFGSDDRLRFGRSANRTELDYGNSGAGVELSSGFDFSDPGGYLGSEVKETFCSDTNTSLKGRRVSPENDLGDFSCDSEVGFTLSLLML